jgi:hypothetical protein
VSAKVTGVVTVKAAGARAQSKSVALPKTSVAGWPTKSTSINHSVDNPNLDVTVAPAFGRKVVLEKWVAGTWQSTRTFTTGRYADDQVEVELPATWSITPASSWRLRVPATVRAAGYATPTWKVTVPHVYRLGETLTNHGDQITLKSVTTATSYLMTDGESTIEAPPGKKFFIVTMDYVNRGADPVDLTGSGPHGLLRAFDTAGRELSFSPQAVEGSPQDGEYLLTGEGHEYKIAFSAGADWKIGQLTLLELDSYRDEFVYYL